MADETTNGVEAGASSAGTLTTENMVPQSRFNEVNNALKAMREEMDAMKAANQAAETKRLEAQQEWQTLAEQRAAEIERLKQIESNYTSVNSTLDSILEAQLAELTDDARAMVPKALTKQQQLDWIAENRARLTRPVAPSMDAGARGDANIKNVVLTAAQERARVLSGLSHDKYVERMQQIKQTASHEKE